MKAVRGPRTLSWTLSWTLSVLLILSHLDPNGPGYGLALPATATSAPPPASPVTAAVSAVTASTTVSTMASTTISATASTAASSQTSVTTSTTTFSKTSATASSAASANTSATASTAVFSKVSATASTTAESPRTSSSTAAFHGGIHDTISSSTTASGTALTPSPASTPPSIPSLSSTTTSTTNSAVTSRLAEKAALKSSGVEAGPGRHGDGVDMSGSTPTSASTSTSATSMTAAAVTSVLTSTTTLAAAPAAPTATTRRPGTSGRHTPPPPPPPSRAPDLATINDTLEEGSPSPPVLMQGLEEDNYTYYKNCSNDYCVSYEDYVDMIVDYIFPSKVEWFFIGLHAVVFVGGLVGNALVCVAVYCNHTMRTVTNYFIVNLAVADFLVILVCLPPTVIWDVTETWFMGTALCKIVLYFQTVSVTVSVLTLTFISVDRWYAICYPLKFKSTTSRAKKAIGLIWALAFIFDSPELFVLETKKKDLRVDVIYFTQCQPSWDVITDTTFHVVKTFFLFFFPLGFMTVAYVQIIRVLWSKSNIPGHAESKSVYANSNGNGVSAARRTMNRSISSSSQVLGRRKAAKMLVVVDIMFACCYLPVHIYSILRYAVDIHQTEATTTFAMLSHWLCYFNSAINPLIYNFMSGKFRKEFSGAFRCSCTATRLFRRRAVRGSAKRSENRSPSTPSSPMDTRTEMVPLSSVVNFDAVDDD